jgi:hypothetical protein
MAIRDNFAVATTIISNTSRNIILAVATHKLHFTDVLLGEASTVVD